MHRLNINLGSTLWNVLSYTGYLKEEELSVMKQNHSSPTGLFHWIKTVMGWYSTHCLWSISFKLCSQMWLRVRGCPVFMHSVDAAAHSSPPPRPYAQSTVQSQPESSGSQRHTGAPAAANCPHHLWSLMSLQVVFHLLYPTRLYQSPQWHLSCSDLLKVQQLAVI